MSDIVVSVCILTYNHANYIEEALASVMMQKVNFAWEVIIADDCSTDASRDIIMKYKAKYPDIIKLIFQEKNVGAGANFKALMQSASGKYIAYLESDDKWINENKLQMQVDVFTSNPNVSVVYGNAFIYDSKNPASNIYFKTKPPAILDKYAVMTHVVVPTCTMMWLNIMKEIPAWFEEASAGDHFLLYILSRHGNIHYIDEILGQYNHHYGGVSRSRNLYNKIFNDSKVLYNLISYHGNDPEVNKIILSKNISTIDFLFHNRAFGKAIKLFWTLPIKHYRQINLIRYMKLLVKTHLMFFLSKNLKSTHY